jgi:hypothetical protein
MSVVKLLSPVSLLVVRRTEVSMAGGFGFRRNLGNFSMVLDCIGDAGLWSI